VNAYDILSSSPRVSFVAVGAEDLTLSLGISPSLEGDEVLYAKSKVIIDAGAAGVVPLGLPGTIADFSDLEGLRKSALKGKRMGFKGAFAIHPAQVPILNEAFTFSSEDIEQAARIAKAYESSLAQDKGAVQLDGKMIDAPVYERAIKLLSYNDAVKELENKKRSSLSKIVPDPASVRSRRE
jgi:citrate lyase subunit beta/citryl-CoA lyase